MKLYSSIGPNPRMVKMFAAEKGIELPLIDVNIIEGENRRMPLLSINPAGQTPVLLLDNGMHVAETSAICEYLEERFPDPPLIGATAEERAATRMWLRRIDLNIVQPITAGFRAAEGLAMFASRTRCIPQAAEDFKTSAREGLAWIEEQMADRQYVGGASLTVADILLFCFVEFGSLVGQQLDPAHRRLSEWHRRMAERPSAKATE